MFQFKENSPEAKKFIWILTVVVLFACSFYGFVYGFSVYCTRYERKFWNQSYEVRELKHLQCEHDLGTGTVGDIGKLLFGSIFTFAAIKILLRGPGK